MKLMYCAHCGDIVRLFPQRRTCKCGKSWGQYLEDDSTTVQTWPSLSIGVANPDFAAAQRAFAENVNAFSPSLSMRCWINPLSEPDVRMVKGEPIDRDVSPAGESVTVATAAPTDPATDGAAALGGS
jgi:hypothetical protein